MVYGGIGSKEGTTGRKRLVRDKRDETKRVCKHRGEEYVYEVRKKYCRGD